MAPLIPIQTLSYYLSKSGFTKFRDWFNSIKLLILSLFLLTVKISDSFKKFRH